MAGAVVLYSDPNCPFRYVLEVRLAAPIAATIAAGARRVLVACGETATMERGVAISTVSNSGGTEIVALCDT